MRHCGPALALLVLALVLAALSIPLRLGTLTRPAAGFFPFWLAVGLAATAAGLLVAERAAVRAAREPRGDESTVRRRRGVAVPAGVTAALALYGLALEAIGLVAATALLLAVLWLAVERLPLGRAVAAAVVTTAATWALFDLVLRVRLPRGWLGF
jgi:hypothetical protein